MNLQPLPIQSLLAQYHIRPKKSLGQNFLVNPVILQKIVDLAEIPSNTSVLEIGPGAGSLTRYLAMAAEHVVAVELDSHLLPMLREVLEDFRNVEIVQGDILDLDPSQLLERTGYFVVANIPYYITSALFRHLLESRIKPGRIVLTVQKEVAQRICEKPGNLNLLALSVQIYGSPRIAMGIPAGAFYPVPKVDSNVVRVDLYREPLIPRELQKVFFQLARAGFSQKRKKLRNALTSLSSLKADKLEQMLNESGINPQARAQELNITDWLKLSKYWVNISKKE
jgi:16S rRNA (adenine1518-N6/adenine1519-N6)-dimethyltransferase